MKQLKANLVEIFSSYQGEGLYLGAKQIFIRFAGCNLDCSFCDTEKDALMKDVSVEDILEKINELEETSGLHRSISLTGGEPLLHADFLKELLPCLKKKGLKVYLETNGTLARELKSVIRHVDIIAMDIKLPSSSSIKPVWKKHIEFLKIARKKDVFIKVVVTKNTEERDIIQARDIVGKFDRKMFFVLQPANATEKEDFTIKKEKILDYSRISQESLENVRIIPQLHKLLGIR